MTESYTEGDGGAVVQIERISREAAAVGKTVEIDGVTYSCAELHDMRKTDNLPIALQFASLKSFADYVNGTTDDVYREAVDGYFVHVESPMEVSFRSGIFGQFRQRATIAKAVFSAAAQPWGQKLSNENFVVWLYSRFAPTDSRRGVIQLVSDRVEKDTVRLADDGFTQQVVTSTGVRLGKLQDVKNPIVLRPYRTFAEIDPQPESPFVLRCYGGGETGVPTASLAEADGGAWEVKASEAIKAFLESAIDAENVPIYG